MKIVVLAGGLSTERTVSLSSGTMVCRALRNAGHDAVLLDLFLGLEDWEGPLEQAFYAPDGCCSEQVISTQEPDLEQIRAGRKKQGKDLFGEHVLELCALADVVFLALHGACGEDGRVQATFDLMGIPYTGAGYLGSAMAMDKAVSKRIMESIGVRTPAWRDLVYTAEQVEQLAEELPVPSVVKIVNGGSSIGVAMAEDRVELKAALEMALKYGDHVIVEEKIVGRELSQGVLEDRWLPAIEIIPESGYYDYETKYQAGMARDVCPAEITPEQQQEMGEAALALHRALGLTVYSRTDFLLDEEGKCWCLEINTLPGMTPLSLLPQEAAAVGIGYEALCQRIIEESLRERARGR